MKQDERGTSYAQLYEATRANTNLVGKVYILEKRGGGTRGEINKYFSKQTTKEHKGGVLNPLNTREKRGFSTVNVFFQDLCGKEKLCT